MHHDRVANSFSFKCFFFLITHQEKLHDFDWLILIYCEFIRNSRANSVIRGKLQI